MSLPQKAIDRLFERLAATYGSAWTRQWQDVPMADVKTAWMHELDGYERNLGAIAWALENLPEDCPNAVKFRNLCRLAPRKQVEALPEPKADQQRMREELAKLGEVKRPAGDPMHFKRWAVAIVDRHRAGLRVRPVALKMAREVLGLPAEDGQP